MYKRLHHVTYDTRKGKHRSPLIRAQGAIRLIIPALCCPRSIMCVHCPASDSRISHRPSHGLTTQPPSQSRTHDSPTSQSRTHESATVPVTDSRLTYVPVTDSRLTHRPSHGLTTHPPSQSRSYHIWAGNSCRSSSFHSTLETRADYLSSRESLGPCPLSMPTLGARLSLEGLWRGTAPLTRGCQGVMYIVIS